MIHQMLPFLPRFAFRPAVLILVLLAGIAGPAAAQLPGLPSGGSADAATEEKAAPPDYSALADRLENEAERKKLIETLRALAAAGRDGGTADAAAAEGDDPGSEIVDSVVAQMRRAGSTLAAAGALFADLPALTDWLQQQVENPRRRAIWTEVLMKLGGALLAAIIAQWLAWLALRRPIAALAEQGGQSPWINLVFVLLRAVIALVPTAVFAATAYGTLYLLAPGPLTRDLTQIVVLAFVAVRAVQILGQILLAPGNAAMRLTRTGDENAAYGYLWLSRLAVLGFFGYALVRIAERVRIPADGVETLAKLAAFAFAAMLSVLILQNRAGIAAWIRGDGTRTGTGTGTGTESDTGTGTGEARPSGATARVLRNRAADIWHVLALLYIAATYVVWAFDVEGGFRLILRGTLLTIAIIAISRAVLFAADRGFRRLFAIRAETRMRFPGLEERANRYLPLMLGVIRWVIYVVAAFAVLQAWGLDVLGWLATDTGRNVVSRIVTILLVMGMTLVLWEAIATGIEYYLTQPGPDGKPAPRSGRVRTLLPLLRRTVSIILGLIATLIVLSELGINIAPLLAGAGVIGLAIGFGAQTLVKDVITGIFILMEDTISVGDVVDLGGNAGVVEDISIRTIRLRDLNGTVHVIPFSEVTRVQNMTRGFAYAVVDAGVAYRENVDSVIAVLQELGEAMRQEPDWAARILEPLEVLGLDQLADSAVVVRVRFKTVAGGQWAVKREFQRRMKARFDELGIEIPFPHQTIYFGVDRDGKAPPLHVVRDGGAAKATELPAEPPPPPAKPPVSDLHEDDAPDSEPSGTRS